MDDTEELQEKTDYTYSHSISYRSEASPDIKVGSPNMSRRGLKGPSLTDSTYNDYRSESIGSNNLSLRSRSINRHQKSTDYNQNEPFVQSRTEVIQQRLDYGLDDSDSETESFSHQKYQTPSIISENGNSTTLVTKTNESSTKIRYSYSNGHAGNYSFQHKQANFPTYTADDDKPIKVLIKRITDRFLQLFYRLYSWFSTVFNRSFGIIKNPIVAAVTFQSWSACPSQTTTLINTTSQTTATYYRTYVSSVMSDCIKQYKEKKAKHPLIWWWIPLLLLILLPLLAIWWRYGELYSANTILYTPLQSIKYQFAKKDFPMLIWLQSAFTDCVYFISQVALSTWIVLKEFAFMIGATISSYLIKPDSGLVQENVGSSDMRTVIKHIQETQTNQQNTLDTVQNLFQSEMAKMEKRMESNILHGETYQSDNIISQLEKQQTSLIIKLEALTKIVSGLSVSKHVEEDTATEEKRTVTDQFSTLSSNINSLNTNVIELKEKYVEMQNVIKSCCNKTYVTSEDMERHVMLVTSQLKDGYNSSLEEVRNWIRTYFVAKAELESRLDIILRKYMSDPTQKNTFIMEIFQQTADIVLRSSLAKYTAEFEAEMKHKLHMNQETGVNEKINHSRYTSINGMWNQTKIESIVSEMLKKYDADRTGMVDHALESAGGSVVSTRCTEGHKVHTAQFVLLGFGLYTYLTNTPRSVIQPSRNPGDCWAFQGSLGYVVIKLSAPVKLTGFTMEHIPKCLSPRDTIDSAPRSFSVYGLHNMNGDEFKLGNYTFLDNGEPLQYFEVSNRIDVFFPMIELKIHSNHGNSVYTCVYRFRVHGIRTSEIT